MKYIGSRSGTALAAWLLTAIVLLMAACGGGGAEPPASNGGSGGAGGGQGSSGSGGQEQPAQSLEELAKAEGTLTWYTATPIEAATALAEIFTEQTGIKVEIFRQTGGPLTETFYADHARNDTKADVITHSEPSTMVRFGEEGLLADFAPADVDKFPADAIASMKGYAYPDRLIYQTIAYNTNLVTGEDLAVLKQDPYGALVDPRFRGQVTLPDPNVNGSVFNHLYLVGVGLGGWDSEEAKAWYEALAANKPILFNSNGPVADAIVAGEAKLGMIVEPFVASQVKQGAPIGIIYPTPTYANFGATAVVANAPHPNAARYFMNWFFSKEGQEAWNRVYDVAVGHADAVDQRDYLAQQPWYEAPSELFFPPDLVEMDEARTPFLEYFNQVFGL